jgi:hypothetical protein
LKLQAPASPETVKSDHSAALDPLLHDSPASSNLEAQLTLRLRYPIYEPHPEDIMEFGTSGMLNEGTESCSPIPSLDLHRGQRLTDEQMAYMSTWIG